MTERIHCGRCRMSFRVEMPRSKATDWTRCAEPNCGRRFWHAQQYQHGPIICGVDPKETEHHRQGGERAPCLPDAGAPVVAQAVKWADLPKTSPAPVFDIPCAEWREPAAFSKGWDR